MAPSWGTLRAKSAKSITLTTSTALNSANVSPTPAVFTIPEVLEHILSFLDQYKLKTVASLVCKQWLAICHSLIPKPPLLWVLNQSESKNANVYKELNTARVLQLLAKPEDPEGKASRYTYSKTNNRWEIWRQFLGKIKSQHNQQLLQDMDVGARYNGIDQRRKNSFPLQSLDVRDELADGEYFALLLPLLPRLEFLTTLRLRRKALPDRVYLHSILRTCQSLEELHVDSLPFAGTYPHGHNTSDLGTKERDNPPVQLPILTRLKVLVIHNIAVTRGALESLIESSPNLAELRIVQAFEIPRGWQRIIDESLGNTDITAPVFNLAEFLRLVGVSCLRLRCFHFSLRGKIFSEQDVRTFLEHQPPNLTEWSFSDQEVELPAIGMEVALNLTTILPRPLCAILQSTDPLILQTHHQRLTRLELTKTPRRDSRDNTSGIHCGGALHRFMCQATHLQHLIAINVVIEIESLDINGILEKEKISNKHKRAKELRLEREQRPPPEIWACRGLQTLHVTLDNSRETHYFANTSNLKVNSQIVFGYLSKCCPRLKDVHLRRWSSDMSQGSGFCLLSRLRELERLVLTARRFLGFRIRELDWMEYRNYKYPSGADSPEREETREVDLSTLGLSTDIKKWAKETKQGVFSSSLNKSAKDHTVGNVCWPQLEYFKLCYVRAYTSDEAIKAPEIKDLIHRNWPNAKVAFEITSFSSY